MRVALTAAGGLIIFYGLVAGALFLFQRRILFLPDRAPPDLSRTGMQDLREMIVTTADGLSLHSWYLPPPREDGFVVLYLHGNAGNIGHRAFRLGSYNRLGWGVLLLEYRGYGGNSGQPSEHGLVADARAGYAALRATGVPPRKILVWGESLGSGVAVRLAAEQAVAAVLLEAPYTSITDMAWLRFPFVPVRWLLLDRFDSLHTIAGVRAPVLVMHGTRDRIIPVSMGRAVYQAAVGPKELWVVPTAGHLDLVEAGAIEAAGDFVNRLEQ